MKMNVYFLIETGNRLLNIVLSGFYPGFVPPQVFTFQNLKIAKTHIVFGAFLENKPVLMVYLFYYFVCSFLCGLPIYNT